MTTVLLLIVCAWLLFALGVRFVERANKQEEAEKLEKLRKEAYWDLTWALGRALDQGLAGIDKARTIITMRDGPDSESLKNLERYAKKLEDLENYKKEHAINELEKG